MNLTEQKQEFTAALRRMSQVIQQYMTWSSQNEMAQVKKVLSVHKVFLQ
jgi:hypothetical protein